MPKSEYEKSLEFLLKVYNVFLYNAVNWFKKKTNPSATLQEVISIWIHPKGITNLIKTIALNFETELPYP